MVEFNCALFRELCHQVEETDDPKQLTEGLSEEIGRLINGKRRRITLAKRGLLKVMDRGTPNFNEPTRRAAQFEPLSVKEAGGGLSAIVCDSLFIFVFYETEPLTAIDVHLLDPRFQLNSVDGAVADLYDIELGVSHDDLTHSVRVFAVPDPRASDPDLDPQP